MYGEARVRNEPVPGRLEERAFAAAWRNQPKWVVSRSLTVVGPNARLVAGDLEGAIRTLKQGTPCFAGARPPLRLVAHDRIGEHVIRLVYVHA